MKKYRVTVNGKTYEVEVEEVVQTPSAAKTEKEIEEKQEARQPAVTVKTTQFKAQKEGEGVVKAPLPGKVIDLKVGVGQHVNRGDAVLILEAMKMENEIAAPVDGTVAEILVEKGAVVNAEEPLMIIG